MVIDTSALIAILKREPEADEFMQLIAAEPHPRVSAATLIEAHLVLRTQPELRRWLADLIMKGGIETVAVDEQIAELATLAADRFGRGSRAKLNFGDLFSYATAKALQAPLLFKGNDFLYTDVEIAVPKSANISPE